MKVFLVSNRLPVTIERTATGFKFTPSTGGLATGLTSLKDKFDCRWIGYSGIPSNKLTANETELINKELLLKFSCHSLPLTKQEIRLYYNNFSNKTIWPLFHYFQYITEYDADAWNMYKNVNEKFFYRLSLLLENSGNDSIVWIHDYHLMLLPAMIKKYYPAIKIGFFLHIPFPSSEIFRLLPWRKEILDGLLGSDLIGFHTYRYVKHFLNSVLYIKGLDNRFGTINTGERIIKVDAFPMGIDYEKYSKSVLDENVKKEIEVIKKRTSGHKVILSIDRLDYTKGILKRLEAYDYFLTKYPEYREKIIFIMVAVPTRMEIDTYQGIKTRVDETVGRINGKYSTLKWTPIWYIYRSLSFSHITALYNQSDIALVTPLRDGMNLVAKEYIACQNEKKGVLILSEMAGVADELGEAINVNPNNRGEITEALKTALSMPDSEKEEKLISMQKRLNRNTIFKWSADFINSLVQSDAVEKENYDKQINEKIRDDISTAYLNAGNRLLLIDYDGTLVSFKEKPADAKPDIELYNILEALSRGPDNEIVIISGRDREILDKWFGHLDISLVAEHGAWIKNNNSDWKEVQVLNNEWKKKLMPILEHYVDRTPGTFIEEKSQSLAWHYRKADQEFASVRLRELKYDITYMISNFQLGIIEGNRVIEIKSLEVNKGRAALKFIKNRNYDFILSMGDDSTDEDMFAAIPESAYAVKIGYGPTKARFWLSSCGDARLFLQELGRVTDHDPVLV